MIEKINPGDWLALSESKNKVFQIVYLLRERISPTHSGNVFVYTSFSLSSISNFPNFAKFHRSGGHFSLAQGIYRYATEQEILACLSTL